MEKGLSTPSSKEELEAKERMRWKSFKQSIASSTEERNKEAGIEMGIRLDESDEISPVPRWLQPPHVCDYALYPLFLIRQLSLKGIRWLWRDIRPELSGWGLLLWLPWLVAAIAGTAVLVGVSIVCAAIEWPLMLITLVTSPTAWMRHPLQTLGYIVALVGMGLVAAGVVIAGIAVGPYAAVVAGIALVVNTLDSRRQSKSVKKEADPTRRRVAVLTGLLLVLAGVAILCLIVLPVFFPPAALFTIPVLSYGVPWFSTTLAFAVTGTALVVGGTQAIVENADMGDDASEVDVDALPYSNPYSESSQGRPRSGSFYSQHGDDDAVVSKTSSDEQQRGGSSPGSDRSETPPPPSKEEKNSPKPKDKDTPTRVKPRLPLSSSAVGSISKPKETLPVSQSWTRVRTMSTMDAKHIDDDAGYDGNRPSYDSSDDENENDNDDNEPVTQKIRDESESKYTVYPTYFAANRLSPSFTLEPEEPDVSQKPKENDKESTNETPKSPVGKGK